MQSLTRRASAEFVGTAFLLAAIVGSGIMADRLTSDTGIALLANALATAGVLTAVILVILPVSGAHINPAVTLTHRAFRGLDNRETAVFISAQIAGGMFGVFVANLMFDLPAATLSTTQRSGSYLWLAEAVATLGLVLVIFGLVRSGRDSVIAFAVGAYIAGAYFFTSSTGFANPAVTIGRMFTDTFAGIEPASAPGFVVAELAGATLAILLIRVLFPVPTTTDDSPVAPS